MQYDILGDSIQFLNITMQPEEKFIAEAGAMIYVDDGINFEPVIGIAKKGVLGRIAQGIKRTLSGEDFFVINYENKSNEEKMLGITGPYVGQILQVNLNEINNNTIYLQKGAYLASNLGIDITIGINLNIGRGLFGGEGFILQKIKSIEKNYEQNVFFHAGGTIIEREIENETIYVEAGSLVGYTDGIDFDIKTITNIKTLLFANEGIFLAKLSGTGKVWIQNLPYSKFIAQINNALQQNQNFQNFLNNL